jgi:hypothetical protein
MVAAIWIVRKATDDKVAVVDGIETVIINDDSVDTEATVLADTEAAVIAAGHAISSGYFSTAALALAAGQLDTDEDFIAVGKRIEVIA